ncbi:hypothetical protein FQA45_14750 [Glutamicibacter halophytocola]|uniref:Uncharacterized protein n=1 Tax=Glutamicibacter halophytocola TaxID=1933880 RepID=A0ABX5YCQ6_9MICC|nr:MULTISPECIES: hypothetical protein [Glutamicibacter]MBF6672606.1 hypothetical protein [Glutamicibacter sp. FBE19]QDY67461.1 hypothetical protein FQA45_14750 [Glutamicibacter halophytocola]
MKFRGKLSLVTTLIAGLVIIPAAPSLAEGSWSSSITNALTGFSSRSWNDQNTDSVATKTTFKTCSETWGTPKSVGSITVALVDHRGALLPAKTVSTKTTKGCGSVNFGDRKKSTYHFTIKKIAGLSSGVRLTAKKVTQTY